MEKSFVVVGTGELAVRIAELLNRKGIIAPVFEKKHSTFSNVAALCKQKNIEYSAVSDDEMRFCLLNLLDRGKLIVISAVNTYIFPEEITSHANFYGINYHNALLPRHRGMNAEAWSIYCMDSTTGITWHKIETKVDRGRIIAQETIELDHRITSINLLRRQSELAFKLFTSFADELIVKGSVLSFPQANEAGEFHSIKAAPNDGIMDTCWDYEKMSAFLRAMDYGILFSLGKPRVQVADELYSFGRYFFIEENAEAEANRITISGDKAMIEHAGSKKRIALSNLNVILKME